MKMLIATLIVLASMAFANENFDLDGRDPGVEVSFQIPTPVVERDTALNLKATPKPITRFDEYIQLDGPVALEDGLKAELAYLPWF